MKKILLAVSVALATILFAATAFASERMTIGENVDLSKVTRMAIGMPLYWPPDNKAPTADDLARLMFDSSRVSKVFILSYDDIASNIKRDKHIDIKALKRKKAAAVYSENVHKYADACVVATVTNGKRLEMFFEVRDAKTFDLLCDYHATASKGETASLPVFKELVEEFYREFDDSVQAQIRERNKAEKLDKDAVKKALEQSKRKSNDVTLGVPVAPSTK